MNPPLPAASRPAEHMLKAHLAHATHHELLAEGQQARIGEAIASVAAPPVAPPDQQTRPRRRRRA